MSSQSFAIIPAAALLLLGACATGAEGGQAVAADRQEMTPAEHDRLAFVQAACGGCHAVEPPGLSPNPEAPAFEAVANRAGLTEDTLTTWLTDAHNYPEVMDFDLEAHHIEMVAEHMLTLRRKDYTPPPS